MLPRESLKWVVVFTGVGLFLALLYLIMGQWRARPATPGHPRKRPALDFSLTGLVYCSMMMFMGLAAINSQVNLLFGVFGLMIGILLISGVVSRSVMRGLEIRRVLPESCSVGAPMSISYEITNRKRLWPTLSVALIELDGAKNFQLQPHAYLLHVQRGAMARVSTQVVPTRRGVHSLNRFQLSTSFPFGFIRRALTQRRRDTFLAYPAQAVVNPKMLLLCRPAERGDSSARPDKGGDDEFYGVKEFRAGDNPRRIYWRRSARTAAGGVLVAKEMTQVRPPRLVILVDTFLPQAVSEMSSTSVPGPTVAAVERAIAMAGSLVAKALDESWSVGLIVWSNRLRSIEPSRGKRHRGDLLSILARLPLNQSSDSAELIRNARGQLRSGATIVLFTPRRDGPPGGAAEMNTGRARDGFLTISSSSGEAGDLFRFEPGVDFSACMPAGLDDQNGKGAARARWRDKGQTPGLYA